MSLRNNNITIINSNTPGYWQLPSGTTAQRPMTPVIGMIRYNTDIDYIEFYTSNGWKYMNYAPNNSGDAVFTTPGTYQWVAPNFVTSVGVVCVGGGGGGMSNWASYGGGGGGLGWRNNISVIPGTSYTVVVGDHGADSYFISPSTVAGYGGTSSFVRNYVSTPGYGGSYNGDGGGRGGDGNEPGGGGAGGYSGNGGAGGNNGQGGGGGGGFANGDGGGVGLYGQGLSGNAGTSISPKGQSGSAQYGPVFGRGGGTDGFANSDSSGAVRIIWGHNRSFPFNAAAV